MDVDLDMQVDATFETCLKNWSCPFGKYKASVQIAEANLLCKPSNPTLEEFSVPKGGSTRDSHRKYVEALSNQSKITLQSE